MLHCNFKFWFKVNLEFLKLVHFVDCRVHYWVGSLGWLGDKIVHGGSFSSNCCFQSAIISTTDWSTLRKVMDYHYSRKSPKSYFRFKKTVGRVTSSISFSVPCQLSNFTKICICFVSNKPQTSLIPYSYFNCGKVILVILVCPLQDEITLSDGITQLCATLEI